MAQKFCFQHQDDLICKAVYLFETITKIIFCYIEKKYGDDYVSQS